MNILVLTSDYPSPDSKGQQVTKVVSYFAQSWHKQGHNVLVIHNAHRYPIVLHALPKKMKQKMASIINFYISDVEDVSRSRFDDGQVPVYRIPILKLIPHGDHPNFLIESHAKEILRILEKEGFEPDIMMGHWMSPQIQLIHALKKKISCKTSLVLHGLEYFQNNRFNYTKYLSAIDKLGCRSKCQAEDLAQILPERESPFVCYSGIPDAYVENSTFIEKFKKPVSKWVFSYVGRLVSYKNIDKVLLALADNLNVDVVLNIIGEGPERKNLEKMAQDLGISDKVFFHGSLPRGSVMEILNGSHCFTMISEGEIFGLVYLEAMLASCITIGSENEGIDGVIENNRNGYLCKAGDYRSLAETIRKVVTMAPEELQAISRNGYETACKFSDSNMARKYLDDALGGIS